MTIIAYADPPYVGQAKRHYNSDEVDHVKLIAELVKYDGYALSCSTTSLRHLLPLFPNEARVAAWVKPFAFFHSGSRGHPPYAWEPVIFCSARPTKKSPKGVRDWLSCNAFGVTPAERAYGKSVGVVGIKPPAFYLWLFSILGCEPQDKFLDMFPGSGMGSRTWKQWCKDLTKV